MSWETRQPARAPKVFSQRDVLLADLDDDLILPRRPSLVELRPDNPVGDTSLGAALYGLGDRAGARASLEKAVSLRPLPDTLSNVGFLAYEEKRYDDAAEKFAAPPRCRRRTRDCSGTSAMRS